MRGCARWGEKGRACVALGDLGGLGGRDLLVQLHLRGRARLWHLAKRRHERHIVLVFLDRAAEPAAQGTGVTQRRAAAEAAQAS